MLETLRPLPADTALLPRLSSLVLDNLSVIMSGRQKEISPDMTRKIVSSRAHETVFPAFCVGPEKTRTRTTNTIKWLTLLRELIMSLNHSIVTFKFFILADDTFRRTNCFWGNSGMYFCVAETVAMRQCVASEMTLEMSQIYRLI